MKHERATGKTVLELKEDWMVRKRRKEIEEERKEKEDERLPSGF